MKIVFMGTPDFSVPILENLAKNHEVVLVVSQPDKPQGRKKELVKTPIHQKAIDLNIECFQPIDIKIDYQKILDCNPDIIVTAAYGQMVPDEVLYYPKYKSINVHASLLPLLRGGAPIHKAITRGYDKTGVTIMYMVSKMDAGDIIISRETTIYDNDNQKTLENRLSLIGKDLIIEALELIEKGDFTPIKQDDSKATYASNVSKNMEHINFSKPCRKVFDLIRGLSPNPGAYGIINGIKVKIYESKIVDNNPHNEGEILETKKRLIIGLIDGAIEVLDLQVEGKKRILVRDFLNGQKIFKEGDVIS